MRRKSVLERSPALDASRGAYDLSTSIGRCSLINMPTDLFRLLKTFDESRRFLRSFRRTERVRRICFVPAADRFSKRALSLSLSLVFTALWGDEIRNRKGECSGRRRKKVVYTFDRWTPERFSVRVRFILYGNDIQTENTGRDRRGSRQHGLFSTRRSSVNDRTQGEQDCPSISGGVIFRWSPGYLVLPVIRPDYLQVSNTRWQNVHSTRDSQLGEPFKSRDIIPVRWTPVSITFAQHAWQSQRLSPDSLDQTAAPR